MADTVSSERPELTARAVAIGSSIGAVLAIGNVYMALKTGWADTGNLAASIVGFAILRSLGGGSPRETNVVQVIAASAATTCFTAGLVGTMPAMALLGRDVSPAMIVAWGAALAVAGILLAVALRERMLQDKRLPFPTSVATAQVITAMAAAGATATRRARSLAAAAGVAGTWTWFRDGPWAWIPQQTLVPGSYGIGVAWSPMLVGTGVLLGPTIGLSMLAGALVAWALVGPMVVHTGVVVDDQAAVAEWLLWPSVALMVGTAATYLLLEAPRFVRGIVEALDVVGSARRRPIASIARWCAIAIVVAVVGQLAFDAPSWLVVPAFALSLLLAVVSVRTLAETDVAPLTQMGQTAQVVFGVVAPGRHLVGVAASSIVIGDGTQTCSTMLALKTGALLDADPRALIRAQIVGAGVGLAVSVPAYEIMLRANALGSESLPAPIAKATHALAQVVERGAAALPAGAGIALGIGVAIGVVLTLVGRSRAIRFVPSPFAVGIGMLIPAANSVSIALGSLIAWTVARRRAGWTEADGPALAAGAISGEAVLGIVIATLGVAGAWSR